MGTPYKLMTAEQKASDKERHRQWKLRNPEKAKKMANDAAARYWQRHLEKNRARGRERMRIYTAANREKIKQKARERYSRLSVEQKKKTCEYQRQLRASQIKFLDDLKMERGCVDCGYKKHPSALHFDHVRGTKHFTISSQVPMAIEKLTLELSKCEVRCANCHAVRTWAHKLERKGDS